MNPAFKNVKKFISISKFIWNHPFSSKRRIRCFYRFFRWQLIQKINPHPLKFSFVENSFLLVEKGMVGATGNIYTGLAEFEDMSFTLHILKPGDLFADIGANVGAYTILASKNREAETFSFEPVASTYKALVENVKINGIGKLVHAFQKGVGAKNEMVSFTSNLDSVNHVVANKETQKGTEQIPIVMLNEIFSERCPQLVKIDVEGFEWNVLKGADKLLSSTNIKAIIIELNGSGVRYGFSDNKIHQLLIESGFSPYKYEPFTRKLEQLKTFGKFNTIYIKDIDWVRSRVESSPMFYLLGKGI